MRRRAIQAQTLDQSGARAAVRSDWAAARRLFAEAAALNPASATTHNNLGVALWKLGRREEALLGFRESLRLEPRDSDVRAHFAAVLCELGRFDEALQVNPEHPPALASFAQRLYSEGRLTEAAAAFDRALKAGADPAGVRNYLGLIACARGRQTEGIQHFRRAVAAAPSRAEIHSNLLLAMHYAGSASPVAIWKEHRRWARRHEAPLSPLSPVDRRGGASRRLRVGYVSPDFRDHSVASFIEPVLGAHDRKRVEVVCFADVPKPDATTHRLRALSDEWISLSGLDDRAAAAVVREREIDILVDLAGHTAGNRLLMFALKPAPVQVSWLGYPDSTGLDAIDWRITDAVADPPGESDRRHSERLLRLAPGFLCFEAPGNSPECGALPALRRGRITFGSFNNRQKITPAVIRVWSAILERVKYSELVIKCQALLDAGIRQELIDAFTSHGVEPDRLRLLGRVRDKRAHLALYRDIDVALDTFPYNGATTTCEAFWMGVPVLTVAGRMHSARVGATLASQAGLDAFVAGSLESYVNRAVEIAADLRTIERLRGVLRDRMRRSSLMNASRFTRSLERAFLSIRASYPPSAR